MRAHKTIPPERLDEVERRMLAAEAPADFAPVLAKQWNRTPRQIYKYVALVRARLTARAKSRAPEADAEIIRAMLADAYATAKKGGKLGPDAKGMVQAIRTLAEVTGVLGPRRVEITGAGGGPVEHHAQVVLLPALDAPDRPADPLAAELGPADGLPPRSGG